LEELVMVGGFRETSKKKKKKKKKKAAFGFDGREKE
jgi:hypothetical protein